QESPLTALYPDPADNEVIWLGNSEEVIRCDMHEKIQASQNLMPLIRSFSTKGTHQPLQAGTSIDYAHNGATFSYGLPTFIDPEGTAYQYRLDGFEDEWSDWTSASIKDYTQLSEGTYTFWVRAKDSEGMLYPASSFSFDILPPWYRTRWAYLLYSLLIAGTFVFSVRFYSRWRVRQLEVRNQELEQTVDERTEEIRFKNQELEQALDSLQATQAQLIMQEKMASLGQMTTGIAHEIKNPLNFIQNFAEGTMDLTKELDEELAPHISQLPTDEQESVKELLTEINEHVDIIQKQGKRADAIVVSMMSHAHPRGGEQTEVDLSQLIEESLLLSIHGFQSTNEGVNIQLEKDFSSNLPPIQLNSQEMGRVLINLINNACYALKQRATQAYSGYTPTLRISTLEREGRPVIQIWDNGVGIPIDMREKVFEPFFTTKTTGEGHVGLGLSISYDIVTKGHQGMLSVSSEPGHFTQFEISLSNT
ncbi:MAG: ATP-binding protein, partial [Bacteroidota bacterium]